MKINGNKVKKIICWEIYWIDREKVDGWNMAAVSLGSAQAYFLTLSLKQKYFVFNKVEINLKIYWV